MILGPLSPVVKPLRSGIKQHFQVEYVGSVDIDFHGCPAVCLTLTDVSYIPGLGFNLYSVHATSRTNLVIFDSLGPCHRDKGHFSQKRKRLLLECNTSPSQDSRGKWKLNEVCAVDFLKQLDHPIRPHLIETRIFYF